MERRKNEIRTNFNRLKEECGSLANLLNTLLDQRFKTMTIIDSMTPEEIMKDPNFFISESKRQYEAIQKVLTLNFDLESFISLEGNYVNEKCSSLLSLNIDSDSSTLSKTLTNKEYRSQLTINEREPLTVSVNNAEEHFAVASETNGNSCMKKEGDIKTVVKNANDRSLCSKSSLVLYGTDNSSESSDFPEEATQMKHSPSASHFQTKKPDSGKYKNRSSTNSSDGSKTMSEKLSKKKLMSREQRYLSNLKKPPMPDLSFRVVPNHALPKNSSSEFCSATDSEYDLQTDTDTTFKESFDCIVIRDAPPLKLNDTCMITYVLSPSEFYVSKYDPEDHDQFENMNEKLTQYGDYFQRFSTKSEVEQNVHRYCMAYSSNWESWNRAEVLDWNNIGNESLAEIKVQFVDYGDYESVHYSNIRVLPHELCEKPKLAVKCHLAYLFAPNSTHSDLSLQWPESSIKAVRQLLETTSGLYKIIYVENFGYSYGIDLESHGSQLETSIGESLLKSEDAVEITENYHLVKNSFMQKQLISVQGMEGVKAHMSENEVMNQFCDNVVITECDKLEEAFTGYAAQDEARTCRHAKNGTCYKGINCKLDHEPLNPDGTTSDKLLTFIAALNELPCPEAGQNLTILITSVCNVHSFYGHIMSYNEDGQRIRDLTNALNAPNVQHPPMKVLPAIGEIVIAKYCDDKWYRARASDVLTEKEGSNLVVKVFFVDFGDVVDVNLKDLRQISERFLHLPFQAVRFNIHNVIPMRGVDKNKAVEYFEQVYLYKKFNAEVIQVLSSFIEVLLTNSANEDIGTQLVDSGHAEPKIVSLLPIENGRFLVD